MPPIRYKPPLPVRFKAPKSWIDPLNKPEIKLGKSVVAAAPHPITQNHLDMARKVFRKWFGKEKEFLVNVHATYARCKKPAGTKMGQGRGPIDHFVAKVPAGKAMFTVPQITPFPGETSNMYALKVIADQLPMPCKLRDQNNHFPIMQPQRTVDSAVRRKVQLKAI